MSDKIIQSYVWYDGKRYFISTIERESSVMEFPVKYNETIAWEWMEGKERGKIVEQGENGSGCLTSHFAICEKIFNGDFVRS